MVEEWLQAHLITLCDFIDLMIQEITVRVEMLIPELCSSNKFIGILTLHFCEKLESKQLVIFTAFNIAIWDMKLTIR